MKNLRKVVVMFLALLMGVLSHGLWAQESSPDQDEIQAMMEQAKRFTEPGENHKFLNRFIGKWDVETQFVIDGKKTPPEKGTCEYTWLMEGRWITSKVEGTMMGRPAKGFMVMGYDNFKQSFVSTSVTNLDTSMLRAEGDLTSDGNTLVSYGTMNEYLTGEHDKMVKYVWRFEDEDTFVLEVHDLRIGGDDTMVVEETFRRQK